MLSLLLPYPPSVNTYWGFQGSRRFLTKKAVLFKSEVLLRFADSKHKGFGVARLDIDIILFPPDKRRRDIDNVIKSLLDSLSGSAFDDDCQIDRLVVTRSEVLKGGACIVDIKEK